MTDLLQKHGRTLPTKTSFRVFPRLVADQNSALKVSRRSDCLEDSAVVLGKASQKIVLGLDPEHNKTIDVFRARKTWDIMESQITRSWIQTWSALRMIFMLMNRRAWRVPAWWRAYPSMLKALAPSSPTPLEEAVSRPVWVFNFAKNRCAWRCFQWLVPVSYTHLTLPTILLV